MRMPARSAKRPNVPTCASAFTVIQPDMFKNHIDEKASTPIAIKIEPIVLSIFNYLIIFFFRTANLDELFLS